MIYWVLVQQDKVDHAKQQAETLTTSREGLNLPSLSLTSLFCNCLSS